MSGEDIGARASRSIDWSFRATTRCHLLEPRVASSTGRPPLLVVLHGHGQSGARQLRWMGPAVPDHFGAAFPDGFYPCDVRRPERPRRVGRTWYLFDGTREDLVAAMTATDELLWPLVDAAAAELGADPGRIWLAGFSMGAYQVHTSAVLHVERVAGWIAQAGNLRPEYAGGRLPDLTGKPVLLQHGRDDEATSHESSEATAALLREHGAEVTLALHEGGHVITPAMAAEARAWLDEHAPPG